ADRRRGLRGRSRLHSDGLTSAMAERPAGISYPSNGQKWTRGPSCWRMNRSHGIPAWVDFATDSCTSNETLILRRRRAPRLGAASERCPVETLQCDTHLGFLQPSDQPFPGSPSSDDHLGRSQKASNLIDNCTFDLTGRYPSHRALWGIMFQDDGRDVVPL